MPKPTGRPKFEPTMAQRAEVSLLTGFGHSDREVAAYIGISRNTLKARFKGELATGHIRTIATAEKNMYRLMMAARQEAVKFQATKYILSTKGGWKETIVNEHTGKDGDPLQFTVTFVRARHDDDRSDTGVV